MKRKSSDPIVVALILFSLLTIVLLAYLASAAIEARVARLPAPAKPFVPPGWVSPSAPPPSSN